MRTTNKEATLKIKRPFGRTIGLTVIIMVILLTLLETSSRLEPVQSILPAPSIASGHRRLDLKLFLLDNLVKEEGRVDCIFLGGSDVNDAMIPEVFSQIYEKRSGKRIICFNFGIDGFIPPAAAIIAKILVEKYRPRMLIWGLSPGSLGDKFKKQTKRLLVHNPWCRYWSGARSFEGWLTEYSFAYRYFLRFRIWLEQPQYSEILSRREENTTKYGFTTSKRVVRFKPKPEKRARLREVLADFEVAEESAAALETILGLRSLTEVIIVEVPLHPLAVSLYEEGEKVPAKINAYISKRARHHGVLFFPTAQLGIVPAGGFRDINHMNRRGSRIFSRWLTNRVRKSELQGLIKSPVPSARQVSPAQD